MGGAISRRQLAAWVLTILLPPLVWALACGLHNCPIFLVDLVRLLQPVVCLTWLEALLAASSGWLRGRPLLSFALGSLALFSALSSPYLGPGLPLLPVLGISEFLRKVLGSPLFWVAAALFLACGLGEAVASDLLGEGRREAGFVLTALVAVAAALFTFVLTVD